MKIPRLAYVEVVNGPHTGRRGRVVSFPWIGNLWHTWIQVNTPATAEEIVRDYGPGYGDATRELLASAEIGFGPRFWLNLKASDVKRIEGSESQDRMKLQTQPKTKGGLVYA